MPKHLKYAFLQQEQVKPVIISTGLTELEEKKLLEILRKYKEAVAWSIEDFTRVNPSIFIHKILLEENAKTSIEHQRRLNSVMKEVVIKKSIKMANYRLHICNLIQPLGEPSSYGSKEGRIHCDYK